MCVCVCTDSIKNTQLNKHTQKRREEGEEKEEGGEEKERGGRERDIAIDGQ